MGYNREYQRAYKKSEHGRKGRKAYKRRYYAKTAFAKKHLKPWSAEEEKLVISHEIKDTELAAKLGRSVGAIQKKRCRLKKGGAA